jgi:hypothetical protein
MPMGGSHLFDGDCHIQLQRYGTEELADASRFGRGGR